MKERARSKDFLIALLPAANRVITKELSPLLCLSSVIRNAGCVVLDKITIIVFPEGSQQFTRRDEQPTN